MRSILIVFMTQYLVTRAGVADHMSDPEARKYFSYFVSAVYFLPIFGAILSEGFLGKYKTIFWLSIVYCFGHFALALDDTRLGLVIGLGLISLGSGGISRASPQMSAINLASRTSTCFPRSSVGSTSRSTRARFFPPFSARCC